MFKKLKKYLTMFTVLSLIIPSFMLNLLNVDKALANTMPNIVINEVMVNPNSGNEWIELYNKDNQTYELSNSVFTSIGGVINPLSFSPSIIPANGYSVALLPTSSLVNPGDDLAFRYVDENGQDDLDNLKYGSNPYTNIVAAPDNGKTIGRVNDGECEWYVNLTETPGATNNISEDLLPPRVSSTGSAHVQAGANNARDIINSYNVNAVTTEFTYEKAYDPAIDTTKAIVFNSSSKISGSSTGTINTSALSDSSINPLYLVGEVTRGGIATEYLPVDEFGYAGQTITKDTVAPAKPTAAQVKATANNNDNFINSYSKTNVTVSVTLPAPLLASDTVKVDLSDGVSVDQNITGQTTSSILISGIDTSNLDEGNVTVNAEVIDQAGNPSGWFTSTLPATKDTVAPTSTITLLDNSYGHLTWPDQINGTANDATSGITGIMVSLKRSFDNKYFNGNTWQTDEYYLAFNYADGNWSTNISSTLLENGLTYTVKSLAADAAGNLQTSATTKAFTFDTSVPSGTFTVNDGAVYTTTNNVTLKMTASADATKMQFSNDNLTWSSWENLATTKAWTLISGDGNKTIYARFKNAAGNESAKVANIITFDTNAPTGTLSINSGATYTNSKNVTLSIAGTDITSGMDKMHFSNDNLTWSEWESFNTAKSWILADNDGTKTVYVRLKDKAGNITSAIISDSIILDATAPAGGSISINSGTNYTNILNVALALNANDALSGMDKMQFSTDNSTWNSWETYATSKAFTLTALDGLKNIYVKFKDLAGNETTAIFSSITLDTTLPTGTIAINNGANYSKSTSVTLNLTTTDTSGVKSMAFSNNGVDFSAWEDYSTAKTYTLPTGDGDKTVYGKFMDKAGNISLIVSDTIILDTTSPADAAMGDSPNGQTITKGSEIKLSGTSEPNAQITIKIYSEATFTDYTNATSSGNWSYTVASATLDKLAAGEHKITLIITDSAGNSSNEVQIANFTLNDQVTSSAIASSPSASSENESVAALDENQGQEVTTIGPELGDTKGEETTNTNKTTRTLVTLAIVIIAIGAISGGYYGYQWWTEKEVAKKKTKKSTKSEKFGRW